MYGTRNENFHVVTEISKLQKAKRLSLCLSNTTGNKGIALRVLNAGASGDSGKLHV
jgi:hypothetical protein